MNTTISDSKTIIYTCITSEYDSLIEPTMTNPKYKFVCFTDGEHKNSNLWEIRPLIKNFNSNKKNNRYHKMHPHILFPNNQYSIYIDGNIGLRGNHLFKRVQELITNQTLLSMAKHPFRDCVYDEAEECLRLNKSDPFQILNQVIFLKNNAYPRSNGLIEANIIFRKHHNLDLIDLMDSWWSLFCEFPTRDQLIFNYILWEKEFSDFEYFFDQNDNQLRKSSDYIFELHNYEKVDQDINEKGDRCIIHRVFIRFNRYSRDFIVFINRFAKNPLYQFFIKQILKIKY